MGGAKGNTVSLEMRTKAFQLFVEGGHSIQEIADTVGCCRTTIKKLRASEDWDNRMDTVYAEALDQVEATLTESISQSLKIVQMFKGKLLKAVKRASGDSIPLGLIRDLPAIHAFEVELLGQVHAAAGSGELALYSDEQLERLIRDRPAASGSGGECPPSPDGVHGPIPADIQPE